MRNRACHWRQRDGSMEGLAKCGNTALSSQEAAVTRNAVGSPSSWEKTSRERQLIYGFRPWCALTCHPRLAGGTRSKLNSLKSCPSVRPPFWGWRLASIGPQIQKTDVPPSPHGPHQRPPSLNLKPPRYQATKEPNHKITKC